MDEFIPYNLTTFPLDELERRIGLVLDPIELNRLRAAYEFAECTHEGKKRNDGSPYFFHCARVCRILHEELGIADADILSAALLHDVMEDDRSLTRDILTYNFGMYVAYIVEVLTKDLEKHRTQPDIADYEQVAVLQRASVDCLLIRLVARLDNFRCLEYSLKRNPLIYIENTINRYLPLAAESENKKLQYVTKMLLQEKNKFLG